MQAAATIFEQMRPQITQLSETERFALIRSIALLETKRDSAVNEAEDDSQDEMTAQLMAEQAAWLARPKTEREAYKGKFLAISNGNVIDQDLDQRALVMRVRQRFGDAPIPIIHGDWDKIPEYTILSPQFVQ